MLNLFRARLHVEELDARITPSAAFAGPPAFHGLNVAAERHSPVDPCMTASPVFVGLNGGGSVDTPG
jgi:hypothetical protein